MTPTTTEPTWFVPQLERKTNAKTSVGGKVYTDKQLFTLTDANGGCQIQACSESQVFSIGDMGTNYCDVKMLYCGSADGCKPVKHDFATSGETTEKFAQSTVDLKDCLKI